MAKSCLFFIEQRGVTKNKLRNGHEINVKSIINGPNVGKSTINLAKGAKTCQKSFITKSVAKTKFKSSVKSYEYGRKYCSLLQNGGDVWANVREFLKCS